jgi:hypothetical protein
MADGCDCSEPTHQEARPRATIVFREIIIALRPANKRASPGRDTGRIAVFRTIRVWKGDVGRTLKCAQSKTPEAAGDSPEFLTLGAELIVYASQPDGEYQPSFCSRTRFVKYASKDLEEVGPDEGPKPSRPFPEKKIKVAGTRLSSRPCVHSWRSAVTGLIRIARRAGIQQASAAIATIITSTIARVSGSVGWMP